MPVDLLGPLSLAGIAKDPPLHVLGLHHKHAKGRHDNVVDLGGAVFGGQGDVAYQVINGFIEKQARGEIDHGFAKPAFEPGRFDNTGQYQKGNQVPVGGDELLKNQGNVHGAIILESPGCRHRLCHHTRTGNPCVSDKYC